MSFFMVGQRQFFMPAMVMVLPLKVLTLPLTCVYAQQVMTVCVGLLKDHRAYDHRATGPYINVQSSPETEDQIKLNEGTL